MHIKRMVTAKAINTISGLIRENFELICNLSAIKILIYFNNSALIPHANTSDAKPLPTKNHIYIPIQDFVGIPSCLSILMY